MFGVYLILKYAFGAILPFLLALVVALPLSSLAKKAAQRCGGRESAWAAFFVICFWGFVVIVLYALAKKLYFEATELFDYFENNLDAISESLRDTLDKLLTLPSRLPIFKLLIGNGKGGAEIGDTLKEWLSKLLEVIGGGAAKAIAGLALGTPRFIIGCAVTVISSFYFCRDMNRIKKYLLESFPESVRGKTQNVSKSILDGLKAYAKAYSKLFLVSFFSVFAGLLILGRKYALLIALLLAFFDLLPLFGAGIVLVPWGVVLIAQGAFTIGVGLIVLAVLISVVRQICEPRFVGKELGIHPLASLAAMYIGLRIFGFWGMVIAPIAILFVRQGRREMQNSKK